MDERKRQETGREERRKPVERGRKPGERERKKTGRESGRKVEWYMGLVWF